MAQWRCDCDNGMYSGAGKHNQPCSTCYWRSKYSRFEGYDMDTLIKRFQIEKRQKYKEETADDDQPVQ